VTSRKAICAVQVTSQLILRRAESEMSALACRGKLDRVKFSEAIWGEHKTRPRACRYDAFARVTLSTRLQSQFGAPASGDRPWLCGPAALLETGIIRRGSPLVLLCSRLFFHRQQRFRNGFQSRRRDRVAAYVRKAVCVLLNFLQGPLHGTKTSVIVSMDPAFIVSWLA
jgi:hypothetical protein